jgi:hypothetical protein
MAKIVIDTNIPAPTSVTGRPWKYKEYVDAFMNMKHGDSFVVNDYNIVDSVRKYAWRKGIPCRFRTLAREKYRIWKTDES